MGIDNFNKTLRMLKQKQRKDGGWPAQTLHDNRSGSWSTACVILLHRELNFLSNVEVEKALNFFKKEFCYNRKTKAYGWGSFNKNSAEKEPIPIITAYVLLSTVGYQEINIFFKERFLLATNWLISSQKEEGFWDASTDYYSNLYILLTLESINKSIKTQYINLSKAIQNCIQKSQQYFNSKKSKHHIYLKLLKYVLGIQGEFNPKKNFDIEPWIRKNKTYGSENFGFSKDPQLYYLFAAYLSPRFLYNNEEWINELKDIYLKKMQDNGFWKFDEIADCIWYSSDIIRYLSRLEKHDNKAPKFYYSDLTTFTISHTFLEHSMVFIKISLKIYRFIKYGFNGTHFLSTIYKKLPY